jgi:hypothetical protein
VELTTEAGSGKERVLMKRVLLIAMAATLLLSAVAFAGLNPYCKVAVYVREHTSRPPCIDPATIAGCADIVTTTAAQDFDAFPVFFDLNEFVVTELGMTWPDWAYSSITTTCSDLQISSIKWPGDGQSNSWFSCQTGVAIPFGLWLYADYAGVVCPIGHPISGHCYVVDCHDGTDEAMCRFCAGAFGATGDDPCAPTGTAPATWGKIKGMFQ